MVFPFFLAAGQSLRIRRFFHRLPATFVMLVGQNFRFFTDQKTVFVIAIVIVGMADDLCFRANQLRLAIDRIAFFLIANTHQLPAVAGIRVDMVAFKSAGQPCLGFVASFPMAVAGTLLQGANQIAFFIQATFAVEVTLRHRFRTNQGRPGTVAAFRMDMLLTEQLSLNQGIATVRMGMTLRYQELLIAALTMRMLLHLRQIALQGAVFIVAVAVVLVDNRGMTIPVAGKLLMGHCGDLGIAGIGMLMFRYLALLLHSNGRQDQGIGGAEHHNGCQNHCQLIPPPLKAVLFCVLFATPYRIHHLPDTSYPMVPKSLNGQTRNTIFPTICSSDTQPISVCRESTDVARWSPIQKYRFSGT